MKNNLKVIVLDTTCLDAMYKLNTLNYLQLFFSKVYIPVSVENEFLDKKNLDSSFRFDFLMKQYESWEWFEKCNSFDDSIIQLFMSDNKMHKGESEVLAQVKEISIAEHPSENLFAVIDEKIARNRADILNIQKIGTLKILAEFHLVYNLIEYFSSVKFLKGKGAKFSDSLVEEVFRRTLKEIEENQLT